jgi:hypothetical protein
LIAAAFGHIADERRVPHAAEVGLPSAVRGTGPSGGLKPSLARECGSAQGNPAEGVEQKIEER